MASTKDKPSSLNQEQAEGSRETVEKALRKENEGARSTKRSGEAKQSRKD
jgi:hypothetical protein